MKQVKGQKIFRKAYERLLVFLSPLNLTTEKNSKRILTGLIVIITCPVLFGYSLYNLFASRFLLSGVLFLSGILVPAATALSKSIKGRSKWRKPEPEGRPSG